MPELGAPIQMVASGRTVPAAASLTYAEASGDRPSCIAFEPTSAIAEQILQGGRSPTRDVLPSPSCASTTKITKITMPPDDRSSFNLQSPRSIPSIVVDDAAVRPSSRWSDRRWGMLRGKKSIECERTPTAHAEPPFRGIPLNIPTGTFEDLSVESIQFSNRGSLIEEKMTPTQTAFTESSAPQSTKSRDGIQQTVFSDSLRFKASACTSRTISVDDDMLSRRVRLMYEKGDENVSDAELARATAQESGILWEEYAPSEGGTEPVADSSSVTDIRSMSSVAANGSIKRDTLELAGGIEDWQNVAAGDVDRYGFIIPRSSTRDGQEPSPDIHRIHRVSTSLLLASATPRRKHPLMHSPSRAASNRSFTGRSPTRNFADSLYRPSSSQSAYNPSLRRSPSRLRNATNRLPHNKDRRLRDEAGDMLTLPPDMPNGEEDDIPSAHASKKKEWEREDKWKKMAKPTKKTQDGSGMTFEFDTHSSKLINRTWKGIPDSWRATAWYAFLDASAKKRRDSPSDKDLIRAYHEFQGMSSPDDVQIDIDVPRTISSHIMFRRRYRGGQRLLFRVLHAMSLYFPDTGYVQGMAALAATLLAYYDEEHAFIMLVRLWQLRGLEQLYRSGFAGLMEALNDFEKGWLEGGEVAAKLSELGIPPTSYGTRWYLTLFNYSIPFPAQLRVWDVFMLLGDPDNSVPLRPPKGSGSASRLRSPPSPFDKSLDVLHATSTALIDGMREILLESDFENAMKVLTSWVPIKDIEVFMRVAKAEFKLHTRKRAI